MKNEGIIPGYHGIMDLDVSNMDPRYIKQAIEQHNNDIKIYNAEQAKLKPEHRYENTILRINKWGTAYVCGLQYERASPQCSIPRRTGRS